MRKDATFVAYIDESGDEGLRFGKGSSTWFVLSAVIVRRTDELRQVRLVDEVRDQINLRRKADQQIPPRKPLHFRDLKHEQRKFYVARIAEANFKTVTVLVHKPALVSCEDFVCESRLYFYALRLLAERLSWFCRDNRGKEDPGDGSVVLVISNRASVDYQALRNCLNNIELHRVDSNWGVVGEFIHAEEAEMHTHGHRMGLQIADAVASSYFYAVEPSSYGMTEESYARLLLKCAYRHQTGLWGYGITTMPPQAEADRVNGVLFPRWET